MTFLGPRLGRRGVAIFSYGRALRGFTPAGVTIYVLGKEGRSSSDLPTLSQEVVDDIEYEMLAAAETILNRPAVNRP